jgi:hypothetical protein
MNLISHCQDKAGSMPIGTETEHIHKQTGCSVSQGQEYAYSHNNADDTIHCSFPTTVMV